MKKSKLLLTIFMLVAIGALCMDCENESTDEIQSQIFLKGTYKLNVKNDSTQLGNVCVYQIFPDQARPNSLYSLAWFSEIVSPGAEISFEWDMVYSMVWSQTGILKPGLRFKATQNLPADPMDVTNNFQVLSKKTGPFAFNNDFGEKGVQCLITIKTDHTIPNNVASIGVGIGGKPAIAINAAANMTYQFTPTPTYWIIFGDFVEGEVLDLKVINPTMKNIFSQTMKIVFPLNVYELSLRFAEDNTWKVVN